MAQVPCIGLNKPYTNLPFGVCAMYFYPQVYPKQPGGLFFIAQMAWLGFASFSLKQNPLFT